MSWYVRRLLLDREYIKESLTKVYDYKEYSFYNCGLFDDEFETGEMLNKLVIVDNESDVYQDLISVEMKISELIRDNLLKEDEVELINVVTTNLPYYKLEEKLGLTRRTIVQRFNEICKKIAFFLGEHFTDEGFIAYMEEKYNLSDKELEELRKYME